MVDDYVLWPIGFVRSELRNREDAPRQGNEGAPDAWVEMSPRLLDGLKGLEAGEEVVLVTWFHQADRGVMVVHPRNDETLPLTGVFLTRSPDRPNPLGLHRVRVIEVEGSRIKVGPLEAIDGTPVVDIKAVLRDSTDF